MSMTPQQLMEQRQRRNRTIAFVVVGVAAIVAIVILGLAALGGGDEQTGDASATSSSASAPTTASTDSAAEGTADGCLGGPDAQTAVLAAHEQAPLTSAGAAGFAASFERWNKFLPRTDSAQDKKVAETVTDGPTKALLKKSKAIATAPGGLEGRWWTETRNGHYRIVSEKPDRVVLDIWVLQPHKIEGEKLEERIAGGRYELRAKSGKWVLWDVLKSEGWLDVVNNDYAGAQQYSGGC